MGDVLIGEISNLFPNLIRSKQITNPRQIFENLSGLMLFLDIKETRNKYMRVIQFDSGIDMVFNL